MALRKQLSTLKYDSDARLQNAQFENGKLSTPSHSYTITDVIARARVRLSLREPPETVKKKVIAGLPSLIPYGVDRMIADYSDSLCPSALERAIHYLDGISDNCSYESQYRRDLRIRFYDELTFRNEEKYGEAVLAEERTTAVMQVLEEVAAFARLESFVHEVYKILNDRQYSILLALPENRFSVYILLGLSVAPQNDASRLRDQLARRIYTEFPKTGDKLSQDQYMLKVLQNIYGIAERLCPITAKLSKSNIGNFFNLFAARSYSQDRNARAFFQSIANLVQRYLEELAPTTATLRTTPVSDDTLTNEVSKFLKEECKKLAASYELIYTEGEIRLTMTGAGVDRRQDSLGKKLAAHLNHVFNLSPTLQERTKLDCAENHYMFNYNSAPIYSLYNKNSEAYELVVRKRVCLFVIHSATAMAEAIATPAPIIDAAASVEVEGVATSRPKMRN